MSALAIIPARGGSKRIPRKNIKPFCGVPMLTRAIRAALDSCAFDRVIVSTDCPEIASVARKSGAEIPFMRPDHLSDDHATTIDVIIHALAAMSEGRYQPETVCCLYPCTPFTTGSVLRQFQDRLLQTDSDYVFPVCAFPSAPQRALQRDSRGRMSPLDPRYELTRTQDLTPAFYDAGQFYCGRASAWQAHKHVHSHGVGEPVDWLSGIDIDTPEDWQRAEILFHALRAGEFLS